MMRYRLQHFPSTPTYQTHVIDYPGGAVYSGQNVPYAPNPIVNSHTGYQRYQPVQMISNNNQYQAVRAASQNPIAPTTSVEPATTTTQLPVTAQSQPIEEVSAPIPAVRAPIHRAVVCK